MTTTADTFTALYTEQAPRIRRLIAAELRTADHADADDLTQDVFLTLWRYLLRGDTIATPAGLLTTMARHRVCDHYRSARVRRENVADLADADQLPASPAAEDVAVERLAAVAMLADYPTPLGVAPTAGAFADWTGADFDSYEVLASIGAVAPAAAVTRARAARPVRRAVRTALRSVRRTVQTGAAA